MKTKGLNFLEAVKAMKEGKKVKRTSKNFITKINKFGTPKFKDVEGAQNYYDFEFDDFLATDWEVFNEDKDWSLASKIEVPLNVYDFVEDIRKCRDLILKDIDNLPASGISDAAEDIVNKRFGDL